MYAYDCYVKRIKWAQFIFSPYDVGREKTRREQPKRHRLGGERGDCAQPNEAVYACKQRAMLCSRFCCNRRKCSNELTIDLTRIEGAKKWLALERERRRYAAQHVSAGGINADHVDNVVYKHAKLASLRDKDEQQTGGADYMRSRISKCGEKRQNRVKMADRLLQI